MRIQTVFKAGNSEVIAIPKSIAEKAGLKKGKRVLVELSPDGETVLVRKAGTKSTVNSITPDFIERLKRVNARYGKALKKLAES